MMGGDVSIDFRKEGGWRIDERRVEKGDRIKVVRYSLLTATLIFKTFSKNIIVFFL